jgi:hypothetical protein
VRRPTSIAHPPSSSAGHDRQDDPRRHRDEPWQGFANIVTTERAYPQPAPVELSVMAAAALDCLNIAADHWLDDPTQTREMATSAVPRRSNSSVCHLARA